jgi:hypothetical protein
MPSSPARTPRSGWRSAHSGWRLAVTPQRRKVCLCQDWERRGHRRQPRPPALPPPPDSRVKSGQHPVWTGGRADWTGTALVTVAPHGKDRKLAGAQIGLRLGYFPTSPARSCISRANGKAGCSQANSRPMTSAPRRSSGTITLR